MNKELIMYSRSSGCPFVTLARRVLDEHHVPYRELFIDRDDRYLDRVLRWTGFRSVPTLVIANTGEIDPCEAFSALEPGVSPRGIDRGPMITEPNISELSHWLVKHGFLEEVSSEWL